ncbi:MAG: hypothetical protein Q9218_006436, partial [Villophora microphyllina]
MSHIQSLLETGSFQLIAAATTAVALHHGLFRHGEWHLYTASLLGAHLIAFTVLFLISKDFFDTVPLDAATTSLHVFSVYVVCLAVSISVYRVFFHRLRGFPGPPLARVSKFWHVTHCLDSKNHLLVEKLHKQYGDFVRTGPRELTIYTPDAIPVMFEGANNKFARPDWFDGSRPFIGLSAERSRQIHAHRRRVWDRAFTTKALHDYEPQILACANQLEDLIAQRNAQPIIVNSHFHWFSFDVLGQVAFSTDFNMLHGQNTSVTKLLRGAMRMVGPLTPVPWLMCFGSGTLMSDFKRLRKVDQQDISKYLIDWSLEHKTLEADLTTLRGDALSLVIAGTDTVALTLTYLFYRLALHPQEQQKLQSELDALDSTTDFTSLQQAEHLNGIINETLRLHPPTITGSLRETPPEGAMILGIFVPGNVLVCAPRCVIGK